MKTIHLLFVGLSTLVLGCGTINEENNTNTLYEDAEESLSVHWHTVSGGAYPSRINAHNESNYCVNLPVHWETPTYNPHEYYLILNNKKHETILELDVGGTGMILPHYMLGVQIETTYGRRTLFWDSFYTHSHIEPSYKKHQNGSATMVFESPIELVRGFDYEEPTTWSHFKVDTEKYLHHFEPNNTILTIDKFIATGGNLDNIQLSSK